MQFEAGRARISQFLFSLLVLAHYLVRYHLLATTNGFERKMIS